MRGEVNGMATRCEKHFSPPHNEDDPPMTNPTHPAAQLAECSFHLLSFPQGKKKRDILFGYSMFIFFIYDASIDTREGE